MDTAFEILSKAFLCGMGLGAGLAVGAGVVCLAFSSLGGSLWLRWHKES
jgi:hypothetical protein